jgi:PAS domain S-box-containing protein
MTPMPARRILATVFLASSLPFLLVVLFPARFHGVMDSSSYLVFHNSAEFFSVMVSLSVFGVGWYAYDQSKDRHALFLGTAFLAIGLIDVMHALGNAAMPAFVTANSTNKSTQYWVSARLLEASALLVSASVYPDQPRRWLRKRNLLTAAFAVSGLVFTGVTFFPSSLPATFVQGVGLTPFKVLSEYLVIAFLLLALRAYWKRMERTGDRLLIYYMAAFIIGVFSEAAFASYKTGFDTYNVLGHVYKVAAFYLIYKGAFAASVAKPYLQLFASNDRLRTEVAERKHAEDKVRALNAELEQRVLERTSRLEAANRELEENREWLRVTLSSIGDAVLACDTAGRVTFENPMAATLTGWPPAEALGHPIESIFKTIDERSGAPAEDIVGRVAQEGRAAALANHTALVTRAGRAIPIEDSAAPILDGNGAVSGVVLVFHDVTEKRRAEEALRDSEERYRNLIEAANDGIWIADMQARTTFVNAAMARMLGYSPEEMIGRPAYDFMDEEARAVARRDLERRHAGHRGHYEQRYIRKDGSTLWAMAGATPLRDKEGRITATMGVVLDMTDRKRAEEALREAGRRKDEFLGMLSHELRNPLAPIRNSVYILERADPTTEQASRARTVIKRQTEHLTRLVDDLLDVTRIARGKIELRRSRVDLREVVQRAAEDFRLMMEERGVAFRTVVPESTVWSDADATRITQILGNLLHNAAKFTTAGDEVTLSVRAAAGEAEIRVRDTGSGIDAALLPTVFDAFVQGERTLARAEGGLGLGLALVRGITELHGGSVRAESGGTGMGAEFVVRFPLVPAALMEERQPAGVQRTSQARRVLVVDDNVDAADSLGDVVKMLGHDVDVAYDGPSAVERARANPPDVVLCDVGLPGMSGYDVARVLRASTKAPQLVFAVSGYAQPEDVRKAVEAGFDGHVAKPCDPAEIERLLA